ncbi:MAG: AhpC/TSA family protein [Flavobacterium sp.]|nr:AhpC/TSA family protein [Flavobacterium sp.]
MNMKPMLLKFSRVILLVTTALIVFSCNKAGENEYIITGTIKGVDGKKVYLEVQDDMTGAFKTLDTVVVEGGKFTIKGSAKEADINLIQIESVEGKIPFILENGDIEMDINKDSLSAVKVTGTYNNDELTAYRELGSAIQKKMMKFQKDNMAKMNQAQQKKDTATINALSKEYFKFQKDFAAQSEEYVKTHPKAFISLLLIESFFQQMVEPAKITTYFNGLDKELKANKHGKKIKSQLDIINKPAAPAGVAVGSVAPDFSAPDPSGKMVSLKQCMGKVTLIDFWASWCNPCRAENPNNVALYNEFHAKGLNIIGVSLDKVGAKWKEAIAKDKLAWPQISNLKYWDEPIRVTYGVESIPATFLLDANGKVVAKDLTGAALKAKVAELLAK